MRSRIRLKPPGAAIFSAPPEPILVVRSQEPEQKESKKSFVLVISMSSVEIMKININFIGKSIYLTLLELKKLNIYY